MNYQLISFLGMVGAAIGCGLVGIAMYGRWQDGSIELPLLYIGLGMGIASAYPILYGYFKQQNHH